MGNLTHLFSIIYSSPPLPHTTTTTTNTTTDDSFEDFVKSAKNENRRSYSLIYSQADIQKFPNCLTFSESILDAFTKANSLRIEWAWIKELVCCMDDHTDGGKRYRMALDLIGSMRWLPNYIYNRHKISVSFATKKCGCVAAYRYLYVQNKAFD